MSLKRRHINPSNLPKKTYKEIFGDSAYKLEEEEKQILVALYASGLSSFEVQERALEQYNIKISNRQILHYAHTPKWQALIKKVREATMNDIAAVAGSHKRVRLERHERIYDKAMKRGKLKDAIVATVEQRKEMEGDGNMNVSFNQFNVLSDDELEIRKRETLEKIKLMSEYKGGVNEPGNKTDKTGSKEIIKVN